MGTLANSEDPDKMQLLHVAFNLGLLYLLRIKRSSEKEIHFS